MLDKEEGCLASAYAIQRYPKKRNRNCGWHHRQRARQDGSQWRILYSIRLPSLVCDFFEVTATMGEGSGESLNRLPVGPHELILADAGLMYRKNKNQFQK